MPLVILCGYPCSGKSTRAEDIACALRAFGKQVHIVQDETAGGPEKTFSSAASEKIARGEMKSGVDRLLQQDVVVIADGANYIKGFRYELYCMTRTMKTPHCVVHSAASKIQCSEWNSKSHKYPPSLLEELFSRFEFPDSRNRWDR